MKQSKATFREICLQKSKRGSRSNRYLKNMLLNRRLQKLLAGVIKKKRDLSILFYYPLQNEADIRKTILFFRKKSKIFLPFMEGKSFKMVPFRLPLKRKKFGIFEAGNSFRKIRKIDIAVVPVIGVDGNMQRIGFGKGMYDRFFPTLQNRPITVFVQLEACQTKDFICDSYDIAADFLVTAKKTEKKKRLKRT